MIDTAALRRVLKTIFNVDDKYLVPVNEGFFMPTMDESDKTGTWIGYRILEKMPRTRSNTPDLSVELPIQVRFRLTFVGPEAEKLADGTMLWDSRKDVRDAFDAEGAQLNYTARAICSYSLRNGGFNDYMCWYVDFLCTTWFGEDIQRGDWIPKN